MLLKNLWKAFKTPFTREYEYGVFFCSDDEEFFLGTTFNSLEEARKELNRQKFMLMGDQKVLWNIGKRLHIKKRPLGKWEFTTDGFHFPGPD